MLCCIRYAPARDHPWRKHERFSIVRSQTARRRLTPAPTNFLVRAAVEAVPIVLDDEVALATIFTNVELIGLPVLRGGLWRIGTLLREWETLWCLWCLQIAQ